MFGWKVYSDLEVLLVFNCLLQGMFNILFHAKALRKRKGAKGEIPCALTSSSLRLGVKPFDV
jgi:hypothetical protein